MRYAVRTRGAFRVFITFSAFFVFFAFFAGAARAVVRDDKIEDVPGFRFENVVYAWDKVALDVVNTTSANRLFGGTMIFLDRRGKPVASASLLPKKIAALRVERYTARFVEGSGEAARRATRVVWDFGAQ